MYWNRSRRVTVIQLTGEFSGNPGPLVGEALFGLLPGVEDEHPTDRDGHGGHSDTPQTWAIFSTRLYGSVLVFLIESTTACTAPGHWSRSANRLAPLDPPLELGAARHDVPMSIMDNQFFEGMIRTNYPRRGSPCRTIRRGERSTLRSRRGSSS